ncbi:A24 family peptidase [Phenylobacterium sp.]|jgi:prepilin peptidase CpaA|uniref:A24 family peptidase n=1 Tax=Phenylobacterium sp. TaxID=1871053 RepID=UPI002E34BC1B|nr:prepilin peptidase [Phenylobacterium sp.]HEX3364744.1 prepilin peptidase [Phenylobacterium sp.]
MIHLFQTAILLVFPILVIAAGLRDATSYTIPNWMPGVLIAAFAVAAVALGLPWRLAAADLAVGLVALVAAMVMFALRWIGGGDAKLFAAAALWLGLTGAPTFLLVTGVAGGALAAGLLALRSGPLQAIASAGPAWVVRLAKPGEGVPYGVAIALGALIAFPASALGAHL